MSEHSRDSSVDGNEQKVRECDDMMFRRTIGNMPAALRKKKTEDHKRFITPQGDPMTYVKNHMRSKSMSDLEIDKAEKDTERDLRNIRYEELQHVKDQLKEDEEAWTSKLQSWKTRRRSATMDALKRKEERDIIEQLQHSDNNQRRTRTYKEIVEDKKKRESEFCDESWDVNHKPTETSEQMNISSKKIPYRGAKSTPNIHQFQDTKKGLDARSEFNVSASNNYIVSQSGVQKSTNRQQQENDDSNNTYSTSSKNFTKNSTPRSEEQQCLSKDTGYNTSYINPQSKTPVPASTFSSTTSVVMRKNDTKLFKERPKSAYSSIMSTGKRSQTLPKSFVTTSSKSFDASVSKFKQHRKTNFASKRNMWENMAQEKEESNIRPSPIHLSTLLSKDRKNEESNFSTHLNINDTDNENTEVEKEYSKELQLEEDHKVDTTLKQATKDSFHSDKFINTEKMVEIPSKTSPQHDKERSTWTDSLFDDMKICINQRPRSEKGFGFTVRGGDDGKPVIVNTVCPGGAADVCQLCVGDEILAINDVCLETTLTQDGIVQLIVDSVITGNLSLDIRRYGKPKKSNPLRLSGTKVVMTPGGFVQVRSDYKGKSQLSIGKRNVEGTHSQDVVKQPQVPTLPCLSKEVVDLPSMKEDMSHKQQILSHSSPKKIHSSVFSGTFTTEPLTNLIQAAKKDEKSFQGIIPKNTSHPFLYQVEHDSFNEKEKYVESYKNDNDGAYQDITKDGLQFKEEQTYIDKENQRLDIDDSLRKQLLEEQQNLDKREAKRQEEKRRRMEEARIEEIKLEEELKRIETHKMQQQKKREQERRLLLEEHSLGPNLHVKTSTKNKNGEISHWLIEEAERTRQAEGEGRRRTPVIDYARNTIPNSGGLSDRDKQKLTKQHAKPSQGSNPLSNNLNIWNDPSSQATLL